MGSSTLMAIEGGTPNCGPVKWLVDEEWETEEATGIAQQLVELPFEHMDVECELFARQLNEENHAAVLTCVRGSFHLKPDGIPRYDCPFQRGRLYVHALGTIGAASLTDDIREIDANASHFSYDLSSPRLYFPTGLRGDRISQLTAINETLIISEAQPKIIKRYKIPGLSKRKVFEVAGFYCIEVYTSTVPSPPETPAFASYPVGVVNDLREEGRHEESRNVSKCEECDKHSEICNDKNTSNIICRCNEYHLTFYDEAPFCRSTRYRVETKDGNSSVSMTLQERPIQHAKNECLSYVENWNKQEMGENYLTCAKGEFVHSDWNDGFYTCNFHLGNGYLFVHSIHTDGGSCDDRTTTPRRANASFLLLHEISVKAAKFAPRSSYYGSDNKVYERSADCEVRGFYCLLEKRRGNLYPEGIPRDLSIPQHQRPDVFNVDNCDRCFAGQVCQPRTNASTKFECSCPNDSLAIYPNPDVHQIPEAKCQHTYFIATTKDLAKYYPRFVETYNLTMEIAHMTSLPMQQRKSDCELHEQFWNNHSSTEGNIVTGISCFPGEFSRHPQYEGVYTCDFGNATGTLFFHMRTVHDEFCSNDMSIDEYTGINSYVVAYEQTMAVSKSDPIKPAFYAKNGRIWERSQDCLLMGLYCIRKDAK